MDNESTRLINDEFNHKNDEFTQKIQSTSAPQPQPVAEEKKSKKVNPVAAAAGGFVAGAAAGVGISAAASNTTEEPKPAETANETPEAETPAPEQVILANDEGVRYAHVEADNFSDAFAQARAQVGAGGVFEYDGKLYGTYTADEWNRMSPEERADYQSRVDEVAPTAHTAYEHAPSAHTSPRATVSHEAGVSDVADHHDATPDAVPANAEMISAEPVDSEIRILGVEAVQNGEGQTMNIALVECEGDQALLVDVDNTGSIDVLIHDDNTDGQVQESEIHDISDAGIGVEELLQAQAAQQGDVYCASADDMQDYVNDADSVMQI